MTTLKGQCLCGNVEVTGKGAVKHADACHCTMCRRQNGGGAFYAAHFENGIDISGDSLTWYNSSDIGERGYCRDCGSTVAWRFKADHSMTSLSLGLFDNAPGKIESRIFVDEAGGYEDLPRDVQHKTGEEVITEFMAMMEQNKND